MIGLERPIMLAVGIFAFLPVYVFFRDEEKINKVVGITKALTVLLLSLAAAQPYVQVDSTVSKNPQVILLNDKSNSADLIKRQEFEPEDIEVNKKTIATGNSSDLRAGFIQNLEPNKAYLAVSDMRSETSLEDIPERFERKNSSLNILKFDTKEDKAVKIEGPSSTVPGAKNRFTVSVSSTRDTVKPRVILNGKKMSLKRSGPNSWYFNHKFSEKGSYSLKASIETEDTIEANNNYYKTVDVIEKPKILFIGDKGNLGEKISKFYDLDYRNSAPEDLEEYYSVVATKKFDADALGGYVARGNGLVYTGKIENTNRILPVKKSKIDTNTSSAKIILAVDISVSTGKSGVKMSKKIAYNLVEELPGNAKVGVVAYNDKAHLVNRPEILATNRKKLKEKISSLKTRGRSEHQKGVKGSKKALNGTGNIIFISDGRAPDITVGGKLVENKADEKAIDEASNLGEIRLISVGVGEGRNEDFLRNLALRGGGRYIDARNADRLRFEFSAGGAASGTTGLKKVREHFITEGLRLDAKIATFKNAKVKEGGKLLVSGRGGQPFLSSWRYGIGRVAAFTGDNKNLEQVLKESPLLASRTVSWAVGSPIRKQESWLRAEDARAPDEIKMRASYDIEGFKKRGEEIYIKKITPDGTGIGKFKNQKYAYSYNEEYEKVGYNPSMREMVRETGGQVYRINQTDELKKDIKTFSNKKTLKKQRLGSYMIALALLIFLGEVGYRKVKGKK